MSAAMKLIDQTIFLLLFSFYICVNSGKISDLKLCADEDCQATISKAQALANYNPNDPTFLSFKRGSVISVKSKSAGSRPDLWSGEINGVRGYFPYAFVREFDVAHRKLDHIVPTEKHLSPGELALQKSEDAKKQQEVTKEAPSDQEEKNAATQDEVAKRPDTVAAPVKDSQKHDTQANIPPPPFKETGAAQTQDPATTQKQNVAAKEEVAQPATTDHKLKVGEGVIMGNNNQEGVDNMKVAEEEIDDTEVDVEPESQTQTSKDDVKESILPKVDEGKTDDSEIDETELEDYDEDHDDNKDVDETEVPDDDDSWSFANDNKNKNENAADKIDEMFSHLNDISPQNVDKHSAEGYYK
ncbi:hypothetical protein LOTGIDRAFT_162972 [Lottia gigantea]|uniref:SH3 domain-containing protein n=1 Tax=Lottia gigantea TaxID=225164 RepID=V3ZKT8_LOTGI|nr:hypothetical protein LOTGIDRAFT_162972 [Lottia gigantea]ESO91968.1 hypothetical protein LOTGIDRAFT_162972 [Lottia gigantea]